MQLLPIKSTLTAIILTFLISSIVLASIEDYFEQITVFSDGRLTRFEQMPIRVYVGDIPVPKTLRKQYLEVLEEVLSTWEKVSDGKVRFTQTDDREIADIRLSWSNKLPSYPENPIGEAVLVRTEEIHVEIKVGLRDSTTIRPLSPHAAKSILLHELGHAIGLWGHSPNPRDVMYYAAKANYPTKRDINTLQKVYSTPVNTSFHKQALAILHSKVKLQPKSPRYHYLLGAVYADQKNYKLAIKSLNKTLELKSNFDGLTLRLAMACEKSGMYDKAIKYYTQNLRSNPSPAIYGALGTLNLLKGKYRKSIEFYRKGLKLAPDASALKKNILSVYHLWAVKLIRAKQYTDAIEILKQATKEYPSSTALIFNQALAFEGAEKYNRAIEYYKQVLELKPDYIRAKIGIASALNNIGASKFEHQDWKSVIKYCNAAIEYDSSCWQAKSNLENAHIHRGWEMIEANKLDEAIEEYQKLLKINPNSARVYNNLGVAFFKKEEYDKAIPKFKKALKLDPQFEESSINLERAKKRKIMELLKQILIPVSGIALLSFIAMKLISRLVRFAR